MLPKSRYTAESARRDVDPWRIRSSIAFAFIVSFTVFVVAFCLFALPAMFDAHQETALPAMSSPTAPYLGRTPDISAEDGKQGRFKGFRRTASLIETLKDSGDFAAAFRLQEQLLNEVESEYGSLDLNTAIQRLNLAWLQQELGHYAEAELSLLESQAVLLRIVGPDHRYSTICAINLAELRSAMARGH